MINHSACLLALRAQAATISVATTGATSLSATSTGYARLAGSFITDGFVVGMEVAGTSFTVPANNTAKVITAVSALALTCAGCTAEAAGTRTLTVGYPSRTADENVAFQPTGREWFVDEDYLPGPARTSEIGLDGQLEGFPMYVLTLYGVANTGPEALYAMSGALLTAFRPHTTLTAGSDTLRVRGDVAPYAGQLLQSTAGAPFVVITIPLRIRSTNAG